VTYTWLTTKRRSTMLLWSEWIQRRPRVEASPIHVGDREQFLPRNTL